MGSLYAGRCWRATPATTGSGQPGWNSTRSSSATPPDQASGDRGVHSPNERVAQEKGIKRVILPQPGRKIVYSMPLMVELVEVLSRSHTQQKYHILSEDITALINLIRLRGELASPNRQIDACRDPEDNHFLEAADEGNADVIVSGDVDLLDMREFEGIPILSVAEFLTEL